MQGSTAAAGLHGNATLNRAAWPSVNADFLRGSARDAATARLVSLNCSRRSAGLVLASPYRIKGSKTGVCEERGRRRTLGERAKKSRSRRAGRPVLSSTPTNGPRVFNDYDSFSGLLLVAYHVGRRATFWEQTYGEYSCSLLSNAWYVAPETAHPLSRTQASQVSTSGYFCQLKASNLSEKTIIVFPSTHKEIYESRRAS